MLTRLLAEYARAGDPDRAQAMARYMKNHFVFFGIAAPDRRRIDRAVRTSCPVPDDATDLLTLVSACWADPHREVHYFGAELLAQMVDLLGPSDLPAIRELLVTNSWWDTVDFLAADVVGPLTRHHREVAGAVRGWIDSPELWLRRTAILHQLRWKDATDANVLFELCLRQAAETEFFIRKAIGWALREYAKTDPQAVYQFVDSHAHLLSPLSRREALKHRPDHAGR